MTFLSNESGAVTVDWVVLTAGLVGLGLATLTVVSSGVEDLSNDVDDQLGNNIVKPFFTSTSGTFRDDRYYQDGLGTVSTLYDDPKDIMSAIANFVDQARERIDADNKDASHSLDYAAAYMDHLTETYPYDLPDDYQNMVTIIKSTHEAFDTQFPGYR